MTPRSQCKDEAEHLECLRDDFAAAALNVVSLQLFADKSATKAEYAAEYAYHIADAMLKVRHESL